MRRYSLLSGGVEMPSGKVPLLEKTFEAKIIELTVQDGSSQIIALAVQEFNSQIIELAVLEVNSPSVLRPVRGPHSSLEALTRSLLAAFSVKVDLATCADYLTLACINPLPI